MKAEESNSINTWIRKLLMGQASDEEKLRIESWAQEKEENRKMLDQLLNSNDFEQRYSLFEQFDVEKGWMRFQNKYFPASQDTQDHQGHQEPGDSVDLTRETPRKAKQWWHHIQKPLRAAAAIAILIIGGALFYTHRHVETAILPQLTSEEQHAREMSQKEGKNVATLTLGNGQKITLVSGQGINDSTEAVLSESREEGEGQNQLRTERGQEFYVTLQDGTRVHLNYNTTLKYPIKFDRSNRTVYLHGEAYFQVAKDSKRPFHVVTDNGTITEYGTTFNINTTDQNGKTQVVLVEGSISVTTHQGKECFLKPGQMATLSQGRDISINKVDVKAFTSWNIGYYQFENCTLEKLMSVMSMWYDQEFAFGSDEIKEMRFTGSIDRYKPLSSALEAIQYATGLKISKDDHTITIYR